MNCPLCIDQTLAITHRHGIELDICPKCRGIWLDRGEIDRLIADERVSPPPPAAPQPTPVRDKSERRDDRDWRDDDRSEKKSKKKKKKKSLAERLGDAIEDAIDELT